MTQISLRRVWATLLKFLARYIMKLRVRRGPRLFRHRARHRHRRHEAFPIPKPFLVQSTPYIQIYNVVDKGYGVCFVVLPLVENKRHGMMED